MILLLYVRCRLIQRGSRVIDALVAGEKRLSLFEIIRFRGDKGTVQVGTGRPLILTEVTDAHLSDHSLILLHGTLVLLRQVPVKRLSLLLAGHSNWV